MTQSWPWDSQIAVEKKQWLANSKTWFTNINMGGAYATVKYLTHAFPDLYKRVKFAVHLNLL